MSNCFSFSSMKSMFQTSNLICQNVYLTDEFKIGLEYDNQRGLLNILLKNNSDLPSHINILSNQYEHAESSWKTIESDSNSTIDFHQDLENEITNITYGDEIEPKIIIELSNIYTYDLNDENENENETDLSPATIASSPLCSSSLSSSSSCFDEPTIDNDDGYSTHSLDDTEQQQQQQQQQQLISSSASKLIVPFVSYRNDYPVDEYISCVRRLIEQLVWLSPFKKTLQQMMNNRLFDYI